MDERRIRLMENGEPYAVYDSISDCARRYGVRPQCIHNAITRGTRLFHRFTIDYYESKELKNVKSIFLRKPFT